MVTCIIVVLIRIGIRSSLDGYVFSSSIQAKSKIATSLTCILTPSSIFIGDSVSITGSISPAFSGAQIYIHVQGPGVNYDLNATTQNGQYNLSLTPSKVGTYIFQASFSGDADHSDSQSITISLDVKKISTTMTLTVSPSTVFVNIMTGASSEITLIGSLSSNKGGISLVPIQITFSKPSGKTTYTLTTYENGDFTMGYGGFNYTDIGMIS